VNQLSAKKMRQALVQHEKFLAEDVTRAVNNQAANLKAAEERVAHLEKLNKWLEEDLAAVRSRVEALEHTFWRRAWRRLVRH
jgi:ubiquinone biosynthesis protein UbiJ